jgi:TolB protein
MIRMRWPITLLAALALAAGCSEQDDPVTGRIEVPDLATAVAPLTENGAREANPVFSPDGVWILYESDVTGNGDIWRIPAAGGEPRQLTFHPALDTCPSWTADGRSVVFESERSGTKAIWVVDLDDPLPEPVPLTVGDEMDASPACSPVGPVVVFESTREKQGGSDIWVLNLDGTGLHRLTFGPAGTYARTASWSPDGAALAYETSAGGTSAIHTVAAAGGESTRITPDIGYEGHPAWSPDGAWIALEARRDGLMNIFIVPADGGELQQVTAAGGHWPQWHPDGRSLVYGVLEGDRADIWLADLGGDFLP